MPKTVTVTMGGREYIITEKVMGVSAKWREHLRASGVMLIFQSLDDAIVQVAQVIEQGIENIESGQVITMAHIVPAIVNGLTNSIDDVTELVYDYSPEMKEDADWLGENAYNTEMIAVFLEVLKLNFPITGVLDLFRGFKAPAISTNLPTTNGDGGTKKSLARSKHR